MRWSFTGHNDTSASAASARRSRRKLARTGRAIARLRRLHLYRALERGLGSLAGLAARGPRGTLMSRGVAERSIRWARRSTSAARAVPRNLDRLLARTRRPASRVHRQLASNERDQAPFASGDDPVDSARARFERGRALEAAGDYAAARIEYLAARTETSCASAPGAFNDVIRASAPSRATV